MTLLKKIIYYFYREGLKKDILRNKIPEHIGIILDGNRRYAKKCGLENIYKGHKKGADKLDEVLSWCLELNVKIVTVWAFSTDNFKRSTTEVNNLFKIIKCRLECYINSRFINDNEIKVSVIGKKNLLPKDLTAVIDKLEKKTQNYSNLKVYIAVGYGGRQEICDAIVNFISDNNPTGDNSLCLSDSVGDCDYLSNIITVENISKYLYLKDSPDPDLIIRTSGEVRLSGFLLWQSAYSEFYFCDAYWPEFREIDFLRAIRSYQSRHLRAGK
ncbi:polyprenyl diphosphate synthase [Candidatus Acidulodesulfobacterium sp. H_13]|uniref:polyprenyl diphosphate synthase n=1 Tax=Candidatus Acidulodesulfobacterium sp. H_13 TaxID=3395470 RepID=UPI003AF5D6EF